MIHDTRSSSPRLSRRDVLFGAVASGALACPAAEPTGARPLGARPERSSGGAAGAGDGPSSKAVEASPTTASSAAAAALDAAVVGPMRADERGGTLVVLLHGWGAEGDDLVSLARVLARPGVRFVVPAAPLQRPGGGRAWWQLDGADRPAQARSAELPPGHRAHPQVTRSREAVQALLLDAQRRYAPQTTAIAGFSQGAMLALDVAIAASPAVDRVAALSGSLLVDSLPALLTAKPPLPRVLVAHGSADSVVPFQAGKSIASVLEPRGYAVEWVAFDGGHEIPSSVVSKLRSFLFESSAG